MRSCVDKAGFTQAVKAGDLITDAYRPQFQWVIVTVPVGYRPTQP